MLTITPLMRLSKVDNTIKDLLFHTFGQTQHLCSPPVFWWVRVAHLFNFLCGVFCFACLRPVLVCTCIVLLVSLDCPFSIAPYVFF